MPSVNVVTKKNVDSIKAPKLTPAQAKADKAVDALIKEIRTMPKADRHNAMVSVWDTMSQMVLSIKTPEDAKKFFVTKSSAEKLNKFAIEVGVSTPNNPIVYPYVKQ